MCSPTLPLCRSRRIRGWARAKALPVELRCTNQPHLHNMKRLCPRATASGCSTQRYHRPLESRAPTGWTPMRRGSGSGRGSENSAGSSGATVLGIPTVAPSELPEAPNNASSSSGGGGNETGCSGALEARGSEEQSSTDLAAACALAAARVTRGMGVSTRHDTTSNARAPAKKTSSSSTEHQSQG